MHEFKIAQCAIGNTFRGCDVLCGLDGHTVEEFIFNAPQLSPTYNTEFNILPMCDEKQGNDTTFRGNAQHSTATTHAIPHFAQLRPDTSHPCHPPVTQHEIPPTTTTTSATTPATPTLVIVVPEPTPSTSRIPSPARLHATPTPLKHKRPDAEYVSPIKKLKKTMQHRKRRIIDTVDDQRDFIQNNNVANPDIRGSIRIQALLLWSVNEYVHGLRFLRLYLGKQRAPEPLHEQQTEYQGAQRDDPFQANQFLITLSLYDIAADDPLVPPPGSVILFVPTKLRLYRDYYQVETKLYHIGTATPP